MEEAWVAFSPQWGSDGSIYFLSARVFEFQVFRTDIDGDQVETVTDLKEGFLEEFAVSSVGNVMAYTPGYSDKIEVTTLNGDFLKTLHFEGVVAYIRFSTVTDTDLYLTLFTGEEYQLLRVNLNSRQDTVLLTGEFTSFDMFPQDSAVLIGDTVYSLTSDSKTWVDLKGYHGDCCINKAEPCYVAISGILGDSAVVDDGYIKEWARYENFIAIVDITNGTSWEIEATPRDTKKREHRGVHEAEFSPDENSLVYRVTVVYNEYDYYEEIGLIAQVWED